MPVETEVNKNIEDLLCECIKDSGAVGAAVAIIDHGKISYFTYGQKSLSEGELVTLDTVFDIGSITKVFTTLAFKELAAEGVVSLNDPAEIYTERG